MSERQLLANQAKILRNQTRLLVEPAQARSGAAESAGDQSAISASILANQRKLDRVLRNQQRIEANQSKILANQVRILAR